MVYEPLLSAVAQILPSPTKERQVFPLCFANVPHAFSVLWISQRFRNGVGGRGLVTNSTHDTAKIVPETCALLLIRGA